MVDGVLVDTVDDGVVTVGVGGVEIRGTVVDGALVDTVDDSVLTVDELVTVGDVVTGASVVTVGAVASPVLCVCVVL